MVKTRPFPTRFLIPMLWLLAAVLNACQADTEARAREAAEKIKESIPDVHARALAQPVSEEDVREAQLALREVKEYLGEVNGKLDTITINAIQAFQRSRGLRDDGILNERTKRELRKVLAQSPPNGKSTSQ